MKANDRVLMSRYYTSVIAFSQSLFTWYLNYKVVDCKLSFSLQFPVTFDTLIWQIYNSFRKWQTLITSNLIANILAVDVDMFFCCRSFAVTSVLWPCAVSVSSRTVMALRWRERVRYERWRYGVGTSNYLMPWAVNSSVSRLRIRIYRRCKRPATISDAVCDVSLRHLSKMSTSRAPPIMKNVEHCGEIAKIVWVHVDGLSAATYIHVVSYSSHSPFPSILPHGHHSIHQIYDSEVIVPTHQQRISSDKTMFWHHIDCNAMISAARLSLRWSGVDSYGNVTL